MNNKCKLMLVFLVATFALVGCATKSGVLKLGPNTYTLSAGVAGTGSVSGNDTMAKREALTEANGFCMSMGKEILVQNTQMSSTYAGSTNEIVFQCLDANDPASKVTPVYSPKPNIVIENRIQK